MKLTIVLPTRKRPHLLLQTIDKISQNMELPNTTLAVLVDEDDKQTQLALKMARLSNDERIKISVKPREDTKGEKHDRVLTFAPADLYMCTADYAPITTNGFDKRMLDAYARFPDGIGYVYSNMANASFPIFQGIPQKMVDKLGYIYPGWFPFWFVDHWVDDVAQMIGRISYADIEADHQSMKPPHTTGLRDLHFWAAFFDAGVVERRREALKIINDPEFQEPQWRKDVLVANNPLIEHYSRWVNQIVRRDASQIEQTRNNESDADERYLRMKRAAETKLLEWYAELECQEKQLAA